MKITKVTAFDLNPSAGSAHKNVKGGLDREAAATCFVMVETDEGVTGYGQTGITQGIGQVDLVGGHQRLNGFANLSR